MLVVLKLKSWFINLNTYAQELNMRLAKFDELDSLIRGMLYVETNNPCECYYWINPTDDERCEKRFFNFSDPYPFLVSQQLLHGSLWEEIHSHALIHIFILSNRILFCKHEIWILVCLILNNSRKDTIEENIVSGLFFSCSCSSCWKQA